jgi:hypothetical protein
MTVTYSARHAVDRIANDPVEIVQGHDGKPVARANIPAPAIARRLTSKFRPNDRDDVAPLSQVRGGADANSGCQQRNCGQDLRPLSSVSTLRGIWVHIRCA